MKNNLDMQLFLRIKRTISDFFSFQHHRALLGIVVLILIFFTSLNWVAWGNAKVGSKDSDRPIPPWSGEMVLGKSTVDQIPLTPRLPDVSMIGNRSSLVKLAALEKGYFSGALVGPAVWVDHYDFKSAGDLKKVIQTAKNLGFKSIFFQVREVADAYYQSRYEPWSKNLTGVLGKNPGWDPLEVALSESRRNHLKLYAWFNVYTVWRGETAPRLKTQLYLKHPDWLAYEKDRGKMKLNPGYTYLSPGNPQVTNYLKKVCLDLLSRYQVAGILLDKVNYPDQYYSYDSVSLGIFERQSKLGWDEWRISQINNFLIQLRQGIKNQRIKTQILASVYGEYDEGKRTFGQDSIGWIKQGLVDLICPLIEWDFEGYPRFDLQIEEFKARLSDDQKLCVGISAYKFAGDFTKLKKQVETIKKYHLKNFSFYSFRQLQQRLDGLKGLLNIFK